MDCVVPGQDNGCPSGLTESVCPGPSRVGQGGVVENP